MNGSGTGPRVAIGCGGLLLFLAFCVSAFGAFHVFLDRGGAISGDEAMPALLGGVLCMLVDVVIVGIGIVMLVRGRSNGAPAPMVASMPSAPVAPAAPAGFPWHLVGGCGTLFFTATLCLSLGLAGYSYAEMQRWERNRDDSLAQGEDVSLITMEEERMSQRGEQVAGFGCCCTLSFVLALAAGGATVRLVRRRRSAAAA